MKFIVEQLMKKGIGKGWRVYVTHAGAPENAQLAVDKLKAAMPEAVYEIMPLSPAFITQGGPRCVAVQYIEA